MDQPAFTNNIKTPISDKFSLTPTLIIIAVLVIISGVVSGYFLSKKGVSASSNKSSTTTQNVIQSANIVGSNDTKTFSDVATGKLDKGGINGEGTHHLIRPGGDSQTVYLISSIVDLDQFVGKQVEINGQTLKGRHSGWLMDVGRVKVLE
jgi:hypothetical protein